MKEQLKVFENELNFIQDEKIKTFTIEALESLPDYFWEVGASSTGRYHPQYALGEGGLARHVKGAVKIAKELFTLEMFKFTDLQKDIILSALFLHDGAKSGIPKTKYTVHDHPLIVTQYIRSNEELYKILDEEIVEAILKGIESHMGQWVKVNYSSVVLPKPQTGLQHFIHMCDYLASRKCLEVNFEV